MPRAHGSCSLLLIYTAVMLTATDYGNLKFTSYNIPFSVIAKWPPRNGEDPQRRTYLISFAIVLQLLATFAVCGRFWSRFKRLNGGWAVDDALLIGSLACGCAFTGLSVADVSVGGFDKHIWDIDGATAAKGGLVRISILTSTSFSVV